MRIRLEVITDNKCSKFHIDAMCIADYCFSDECNSSNIHDVPTSSPIVMRGTLFRFFSPITANRRQRKNVTRLGSNNGS